MLKNILLISMILFSAQQGFAQMRDSSKIKSAKDFIKYKEETDPNMTRLGREEGKITLGNPSTLTNKKCICSKKCCKQKNESKTIKGKAKKCEKKNCKQQQQKPAAKNILPDRNTKDRKIDTLINPVEKVKTNLLD